jgi:hypothetical protein
MRSHDGTDDLSVQLAKGQECLLEYASRKLAFLSLRTSVSDSIPAVWSLANHSLFPSAFQEMTMQLLLARQHLGRSRLSIGGLNDRMLSDILRFLSHDRCYTGGADTESSRLMIDVFINDRFVQPQVDANCSPDTVLWSALHDPKHIGSMLSYLPYSGVKVTTHSPFPHFFPHDSTLLGPSRADAGKR